MKNLLHCVALLIALSAYSLMSEDAATQPTPSTAVSTTPLPTSAPSVGSMPKFPLTSSRFELLDDNKDIPSEGLPDATGYDSEMMLELVKSLQACTPAYLKANVDKDATFKKVFNHPNDFRGHVVQYECTVKFLYEHPEKLTDASGNVFTIARGHLSSSYQLITFLSIDPLPAGLKIGDAVLLTGVFVQRFAYINRKTPGVELTWTPLILAKRLEPITIKEEAPPNTAWIVGYIFFSLMAVGLFLAYSSRVSRKTSRENIFRKIKVQRTGKDRLFPGP